VIVVSMEDDHRPPGSVLFAADRSNTHSTSTTPNSLSVLPFLLPTDFLPFREASTDRRDDQLRRYSIHDKRWIFLGLAALPLWILFGNLLVLLSVIGFRHLRTLSNWVIASLAFTDFLLALTVVPFGIYQLVSFSRLGNLLSHLSHEKPIQYNIRLLKRLTKRSVSTDTRA